MVHQCQRQKQYGWFSQLLHLKCMVHQLWTLYKPYNTSNKSFVGTLQNKCTRTIYDVSVLINWVYWWKL
jgi:hypothetical protein